MNVLKWENKKPKITKECLLIAAVRIRTRWDYTVYQIMKTDCENEDGEKCWYWGIFTLEGDEWGDYSDLVAEKYCVIEPLSDKKGKI